MFGKGGLGNLMKQAQQMQEKKCSKCKEEIANLEVTGESGAGLVKISLSMVLIIAVVLK